MLIASRLRTSYVKDRSKLGDREGLGVGLLNENSKGRIATVLAGQLLHTQTVTVPRRIQLYVPDLSSTFIKRKVISSVAVFSFSVVKIS
jgi:hypothetical protein